MSEQDRITRFHSTIETTDEELLDLLPTAQLENRLRILSGYSNSPLRYRVAIKRVLAGRS